MAPFALSLGYLRRCAGQFKRFPKTAAGRHRRERDALERCSFCRHDSLRGCAVDCALPSARSPTEACMFKELMTSRKFAPLFWCQLCSALNDNFLKNALAMLILFGLGGAGGVAAEHAVVVFTVSGVV